MIRHSVVLLEPVLTQLEMHRHLENDLKYRVPINGEPVKITSLRLRTFLTKGLTCAHCGLRASFFAIERNKGSRDPIYHLNLYGIDDGKEILFTQDHIVARSQGGADSLSNSQTLCSKCNTLKSVAEAKAGQKRKKT